MNIPVPVMSVGQSRTNGTFSLKKYLSLALMRAISFPFLSCITCKVSFLSIFAQSIWAQFYVISSLKYSTFENSVGLLCIHSLIRVVITKPSWLYFRENLIWWCILLSSFFLNVDRHWFHTILTKNFPLDSLYISMIFSWNITKSPQKMYPSISEAGLEFTFVG